MHAGAAVAAGRGPCRLPQGRGYAVTRRADAGDHFLPRKKKAAVSRGFFRYGVAGIAIRPDRPAS